MRKIIVWMGMSLDGFVGRRAGAGEIDWHLVDDELSRTSAARCAAWAPSSRGRVTYEGMKEFWPTADEDPEPPLRGGRLRRHLAGRAQGRLLPHPGARRPERDPGPRRRPRGSPRAQGAARRRHDAGRGEPGGHVRAARPGRRVPPLPEPVSIGRGRPVFPTDTRLPFDLAETRIRQRRRPAPVPAPDELGGHDRQMQPRAMAPVSVAAQNRRPMTSCAATGCGQTSQAACAPVSGLSTGGGGRGSYRLAATACLRRVRRDRGLSDPAPTSDGCARRTDIRHATPGAAGPGRFHRTTTRKDR